MISNYIVNVIEWLFPQATPSSQVSRGVKDLEEAGKDIVQATKETGQFAYNIALTGCKVTLCTVALPTITLQVLKDIQEGLAVASYVTSLPAYRSYPNVYKTISKGSVTMANFLTYVSISPATPLCIGFVTGLIMSRDEIINTGYFLVHVPWKILETLKHTTTGLYKCSSYALVLLKESLLKPNKSLVTNSDYDLLMPGLLDNLTSRNSGMYGGNILRNELITQSNTNGPVLLEFEMDDFS